MTIPDNPAVMTGRSFQIFPYVILAASICLIGMSSLAPRPGHPIAALFPPWWTPAQAFQAAARSGGTIMRVGRIPAILVMIPDPSDPTNAGLTKRLRKAGALLLLDAQVLGACNFNS